MFDMILNFLTNLVIFFLCAGIVGGVIVFCMAATWMQVQERSASHGKT